MTAEDRSRGLAVSLHGPCSWRPPFRNCSHDTRSRCVRETVRARQLLSPPACRRDLLAPAAPADTEGDQHGHVLAVAAELRHPIVIRLAAFLRSGDARNAMKS